MSKEKQGLSRLEEGETLKNRYTIQKVIGRGGFGTTYKAFDTLVEIPVAVKEHNAESDVDGERTLKEAKIAASFYNLEGVAAARDFFMENGRAYIVMDYVEGTTIKHYITKHGRMGGKETLEYLRPIMESIVKMHEKGVIHRDISADNLMITRDGKMVLIDFGAAKLSQDMKNNSHTIVFKRGFAPVEQCYGKGEQGPWTDVYSLCATIYFMVTGMVPDDAVERLIDDRLKSITDIYGTGLSEQQGKAIMKGMAVETKNRYRSVEELFEALFVTEIADKKRSLPLMTELTQRENTQSKTWKSTKSTTMLFREIGDFYKKWNGTKKKKIGIIVTGVVLLGAVIVGGIVWSSEDEPELVVKSPAPIVIKVPAATLEPEATKAPEETPKPTKKPSKKSKDKKPKVTKKPEPKPTVAPVQPKAKTTTKTATEKKTNTTKKKEKVKFAGDLDGL